MYVAACAWPVGTAKAASRTLKHEQQLLWTAPSLRLGWAWMKDPAAPYYPNLVLSQQRNYSTVSCDKLSETLITNTMKQHVTSQHHKHDTGTIPPA
jgi:hypothetical protein